MFFFLYNFASSNPRVGERPRPKGEGDSENSSWRWVELVRGDGRDCKYGEYVRVDVYIYVYVCFYLLRYEILSNFVHYLHIYFFM